MRRLVVPVSLAAAVVLAAGLLGAGCVDGTTPDCSDASAGCGPNLESSEAGPSDASQPLREAGGDADADADTDAIADAADEG